MRGISAVEAGYPAQVRVVITDRTGRDPDPSGLQDESQAHLIDNLCCAPLVRLVERTYAIHTSPRDMSAVQGCRKICRATRDEALSTSCIVEDE